MHRRVRRRLTPIYIFFTSCVYIIAEAEKETDGFENYALMDLKSHEDIRFSDPVKVPGVPGLFERSAVLQKKKLRWREMSQLHREDPASNVTKESDRH